MKARRAALVALAFCATAALISCGGGGPMGAISVIPKGKFYMVSGVNLNQKYNAPIYKSIADEIRAFEKAVDDREDGLEAMGIRPEQNAMVLSFASENANENLTYLSGPFRIEDLEDYFEDEEGWDKFNDDERNGRTYYTGTVYGAERAMMLEQGGIFSGHVDVIEDIIDVLTKNGKRLNADKKFNENRDLVDFNAAEFTYCFDNLEPFISGYKNLIQVVDTDEDLLDAVEDLRALGVSVYWSGDIRVVAKFRFKRDKNVTALAEFLKKDMDEFLEKAAPALVQGFFGADADTRSLDSLADKIRVNQAGTMLEIVMQFTWQDLEEIVG